MSDDGQGDIGADLNIIKASIDDGVVEEEVAFEKPKKKRGRPKKIKSPTSLFAVKRPRGRPKGSGTKNTPKKMFSMADRSEGSRVIKPSERMTVGSPMKGKTGAPRGRGRPKKSASSASPATPGRGRGRPKKSEGVVSAKRGRGRPRKDGSTTPSSAIKKKRPRSSFGPGRPRKDGLPPGSVPTASSAAKRGRGRPRKRVANVKKGRKPKAAEVVEASESDSDSDSNVEEMQARPISSSDSGDSD